MGISWKPKITHVSIQSKAKNRQKSQRRKRRASKKLVRRIFPVSVSFSALDDDISIKSSVSAKFTMPTSKTRSGPRRPVGKTSVEKKAPARVSRIVKALPQRTQISLSTSFKTEKLLSSMVNFSMSTVQLIIPRVKKVVDDVQAESSSDELVLEPLEGISEFLRDTAISSLRPEIIASLDFYPTTGTTNATNIRSILDTRQVLNELTRDNIETILTALKDSEVKIHNKNAYKFLDDRRAKTHLAIQQITTILGTAHTVLEKSKQALDVKDNELNLLAPAIRAMEEKRLPGDPPPTTSSRALLLSRFFIDVLGFSREGYHRFSNTKVLKQLLWDLLITSSYFSPVFLTKNRQDRLNDRSSIKINRTVTPTHKRIKFRFDMMGQRNSSVDFSIFRDYNRYLTSLPSDSTDRIKILIQFVSRELSVSAGMGFLEKKSLGKRFNLKDNPFVGATGKPGLDIVSETGPEASLADLLTIESSGGVKILPFETRKITDRRGRVYIPGSVALVDQVVRYGDVFDTESYSSFANKFHKTTVDTAEYVQHMLNLEDENRRLYPEEVYRSIMIGVKDSIAGLGEHRGDQKQGISASLLTLARKDKRLHHLIYLWLLELRDVSFQASAGGVTNKEIPDAVFLDPQTGAKLPSCHRPNPNPGGSPIALPPGGNPALYGAIPSNAAADILSMANLGAAAGAAGLGNIAADHAGGGDTVSASPRQGATVAGFRVSSSGSPLERLSRAIANRASILAKRYNEAWFKRLRSSRSDEIFYTSPVAIYSFLKEGATSADNESTPFFKIVELTRKLETKAADVTQRDGGDETYVTSSGLTKFNLVDENAFLAAMLEIFVSVFSKFCPADLLKGARRGSHLVRYKPASMKSFSESVVVVVSEDDEKKKSIRDEARKSSLPGTTGRGRREQDSNQVLSRTDYLWSLERDNTSSHSLVTLEAMLESLHRENEVVKEILSIFQSIGSNLRTSSEELTEFFRVGQHPKVSVKRGLKQLLQSELGKDALRSLTSHQLALNYVGLRRLSTQDPSDLPAFSYVHPNDYTALNSLLNTSQFSGLVGGNIRVLSIGIPSNLVDTLSKPPYTVGRRDRLSTEGIEHKNVIEICVHKRDLEYPEIVFKPRKFLYDTSMFLLPGGIKSAVGKKKNFDDYLKTNTRLLKFRRSHTNGRLTGEKTPSDIIVDNPKYDFLTPSDRRKIAKNHLTDYLLRTYYNLFLGVVIDEHTFPVQDELNDLMIDGAYGVAALRQMQGDEDMLPYVTAGNMPVANLTSGKVVYQNYIAKVASTDDLSRYLVPEIVDTNNEDDPEVLAPMITEEEVHTFRALCSSLVFSYPAMKMRILSPTLFDRVFMVPIDPDHFEVDVYKTRRQIGGKEAFESREFINLLAEVDEDWGFTGEEVTFSRRQRVTLQPRKASEGYSTMQDFFVSIKSVTVESD